jgi:G3E family GTPase
MQLIAITGMRYAPKVALVHKLAAEHAAAGARLALLDNTEQPIRLDGVQRSRFADGCVCCTLAASLIPIVWRLDADVALLPVSASADPEALARVLQTIQNTRVHAHTIALIDEHTRKHHPYLAQRLSFYADEVRRV